MPIPARRNHVPLRPPAAAAWVRNQLATSLRSRKPYSVNLLLGGFDPTSSTPSLYWIDYLGTLGTVPYAAHGYGAYFALSTMDRWHDPEGDLEKGLELLRKCIAELETRFIVNLGGWSIRGAFCHAFFFFFSLARAKHRFSLHQEGGRGCSTTYARGLRTDHRLTRLCRAPSVADKDGIRRINLDGTPYEPPQPPPVPQAQAGAAEQAEATPAAVAPEVAATA